MGRARSESSTGARLRGAAPGAALAGTDAVTQLSRVAGNRAVAQILARKPTGAPPLKDRSRIDQLAKATVSGTERVRAYAEIADTKSVNIDPTTVHTKPFYQEGLNLDNLKQARNVPATTVWLDANNKHSGGAPPENVKGIGIVVNSGAARFEDEDYMVAAIRHEMVHVRLMRLTLKHLTDYKKAGGGLSFSQYVDKHVSGADAALVKDRYFGGHMDETVAYLEGFLTAFSYSAVEEPHGHDRAWVAHLKGFTEEFQTATLNAGKLPKDLRRVPEGNIAIKQAANAVVPESEKIVKDFCDAAGDARRKNLAAWMERLYKTEGFFDAALEMIYRVATKGKTLPKPKR